MMKFMKDEKTMKDDKNHLKCVFRLEEFILGYFENVCIKQGLSNLKNKQFSGLSGTLQHVGKFG